MTKRSSEMKTRFRGFSTYPCTKRRKSNLRQSRSCKLVWLSGIFQTCRQLLHRFLHKLQSEHAPLRFAQNDIDTYLMRKEPFINYDTPQNARLISEIERDKGVGGKFRSKNGPVTRDGIYGRPIRHLSVLVCVHG